MDEISRELIRGGGNIIHIHNYGVSTLDPRMLLRGPLTKSATGNKLGSSWCEFGLRRRNDQLVSDSIARTSGDIVFQATGMDSRIKHGELVGSGDNPLNRDWFHFMPIWVVTPSDWFPYDKWATCLGPYVTLQTGAYEATWDFYLLIESDYPPHDGPPVTKGLHFDAYAGNGTVTVVPPFVLQYEDLWTHQMAILDSSRPFTRAMHGAAVSRFAILDTMENFDYRMYADGGIISAKPNQTFGSIDIMSAHIYAKQLTIVKLS